MKRVSDIDKLLNLAKRKQAQIEKLANDIKLLTEEAKELSKPGFKIPKPKKSRHT